METFIPKGNVRGFIMPDFVFKDSRLSLTSKVVYAVLCSYAGEKDHCWPSHKTLADKVHCSVSTIKVCLQQLAEFEYIRTAGNLQQRVRSCMYYLLRTSASQISSAFTKQNLSRPYSQNSATPQSESGYNYNLREYKTNPPLPPKDLQNKKTPSPMQRKSQGGNISALEESFENFFAAYPKKQAKERARSAWHALHKYKILPEPLILQKALSSVSASEQWQKAEGKYIPLACNFLRHKQWEDILSSPELASTSQAQSNYSAFLLQYQENEERIKASEQKECSALRPLYEQISSKFSQGVGGASFGLWAFMRQNGTTPKAEDLPSCTDGLNFYSWLKTYQRNAVYAQ